MHTTQTTIFTPKMLGVAYRSWSNRATPNILHCCKSLFSDSLSCGALPEGTFGRPMTGSCFVTDKVCCRLACTRPRTERERERETYTYTNRQIPTPQRAVVRTRRGGMTSAGQWWLAQTQCANAPRQRTHHTARGLSSTSTSFASRLEL